MTPQLAAVALQLLQRVQISGGEVPAFMAVSNALTEIASPTTRPEPAAPIEPASQQVKG